MSGKPYRILILDDEKELLQTYVFFLERSLPQAEIYGASSSEEAFQILNEHKPNVLLLDYSLKEVFTGLDVLRKALELVPQAQYAIITGNMDKRVEEDCHKAGVWKMAEKPLPLSGLKELAQELMDSLKEKGS